MGTTTPAAALAVVAVLASAGTGCLERTCTLVGTENGLHVDIEVPSAPADYVVSVSAESDVLSLHYEVAAQGIQCLEGSAVGAHLRLSNTFSRVEQGLAVIIGRAEGDGGPRSVTISVFRGDALAAQATFEPRYDTTEPNGPGCGEQVFASAALVVP